MTLHFPVESHRLPSGTRVLLMQRRDLPILSLTAMVEAGTICEQAQQAGLAAFSAGLLTLGTTRRSAMVLAEEVDSLGASLGVHSDYDYSMVGFSSLSRHGLQGVRILSEVLSSPAFSPEEVERRRSDILSLLERRKDDPVDAVRNRFIATIYGDHPYRHPREGYVETISRLDAGSLRDFHGRFYRPENAIIAAVGDFEVSSLLSSLEEGLATWGAADAG
jgi:zinc protease